MSAHDGGPAFPHVATSEAWAGTGDAGYQVYGDVSATGGMTLRDYFAAKAMAALIHSGATIRTLPARTAIPPLAYEYADAMLAAREAQP